MDSTDSNLSKIDHILLVLSGKGGVGKSSVTTQTLLTLLLHGYSVGVLDIDLTGPSIPRMFNLENHKIHQSVRGWVPVLYNDKIQVMSLGFFTDRGNSIVWRGPKKQLMIKQLIKDTYWGEKLDYLIIDTPPGTSDEHITILEELRYADNKDGCIIVTTPQLISVDDVKKEINFCRKVDFPILGVIENMSGFKCPYCDECTNIFSSDGGVKLCQELDLKFLGKIPIDPKFNEIIETQSGQNLISNYQQNDCFRNFDSIICDNEIIPAVKLSQLSVE